MLLHAALLVTDAHAPGAPAADVEADVREALAPLADLLEATPSLRVGLHLSYTLGRHVEAHHPELFGRLQALAKKKRITLVASLAAGGVPWLLSERDAVGQLRSHKSWLESRFSTVVRGAHIPLDAWHPTLPQTLSRAGLRFVGVDTRALAAGGAPMPVQSWCTVRAGTHRVCGLPVDGGLTHGVGQSAPRSVLEVLRAALDRGVRARLLVLPLARLARFGADPSGAWLRALAEQLGREGGWLRVVQPQLLLERCTTAGSACPPASTRLHAGVGLLTEDPGRRLLDAADAIVAGRDKVLDTQAPGLTGPPWSAGLDAWPIAGRLAERAAHLSVDLARMRRRAARDKALAAHLDRAARALAKGSSAAALFDGDGGHVGDPVVRHHAWSALTEAADVLWQASGARAPRVTPSEDGGPLQLHTSRLVASVEPRGGVVSELLVRGVGCVGNVLTPRPRPWTPRLGDLSLPVLVVEDAPTEELFTDEPTDEPTDPGLEPEASLTHAAVRLSPTADLAPASADPSARGLPTFRRELALFQDQLLSAGFTHDSLARGMAREAGDFADAPWRIERAEVEDSDVVVIVAREGTVSGSARAPGMLQLTKTLRFCADGRIHAHYLAVNRSREPLRTTLAVGFALGIDGGTGPGRTLHLPGQLPRSQDASGHADGVADFALRYADLGLLLRLRPGRPCRVDHIPVVAPVRRRAGHIAVHQGTLAVLSWPLHLWGEEQRTEEIVLEVHTK